MYYPQYLLADARAVVYEEGEGAAEGAAEGVAEGTAANADASSQALNKTFSQQDVDKIVQKRVGKLKSELEGLQSKLSTSQISVGQRTMLEEQLEQVTDALKTEKELAEEKQIKLVKKHTADVKRLEDERDAWAVRYKRERVEGDILTAASKFNAYSPKQVVSILRDNTSIVEKLDGDGRPTGQLATQVIFRDVKDEKPVELKLSVEDAVKRMTEKVEDFGNLFKSEANSGLGLNNVPGRTMRAGPPLDSQEEYEEWRKTHKITS